MPTDTLLIYNSRWQNALYALFCFLLCIGGIAVNIAVIMSFVSHAIPFDSLRFFLCLCVALAAVLFGLAAIHYIRKMRDSEPCIIIDKRGLLSRESPFGLIPWSEISSASSLRGSYGFEILELSLHSPEKWFKYLPKYAQRIKAFTKSNTIVIKFHNTNPSVYEAEVYVRQHISAKE